MRRLLRQLIDLPHLAVVELRAGVSSLISCHDTRPQNPHLQALEQRILFSASPLASLPQEPTTDDSPTNTFTPTATEHTAHLVFVDTLVHDYQALLTDLQQRQLTDPTLHVFLLDQASPGIDQIDSVLKRYQNVNSIQIFSHATSDSIRLGSSWLTNQNLSLYESTLLSWQHNLSPNADILLFGCDLASSNSGQQLIHAISKLTGADVAASIDTTSSSLLGGNWTLEYTTGAIETSNALSEKLQQAWGGKLNVLTVTTFADVVDSNDGVLSLREAILAVNSGSGGDMIQLAAGRYELSLTGRNEDNAATGDLDIYQNVTIVGLGPSQTQIDAQQIDRLFELHGNSQVTIAGVTLTKGETASGDDGGAVAVTTNASLTLHHVTLAENAADHGGAIFNVGTLKAFDTTFKENDAVGDGGAIFNQGEMQIVRSTFFGNASNQNGGAIRHSSSTGNNFLENVTISQNTAQSQGGGVASHGNLTIQHATIVNNTAINGGGLSVQGGGSISIGNSLLHNTSGGNSFQSLTTLGHNIVHAATSGLNAATDRVTSTPLIESTLQDNGGLVFTHALLPGTIAINGGSTTTPQSLDARGVKRDPLPDVGAFELTAKFTPIADFPVNSHTVDTQRTYGEVRGATQAVSADDLGNYVVVWSSNNQDDSGYGVYAQRFDAGEFHLGTELQVNQTTSGNQHQASVASNGRGDFVVVWTSANQDGSGNGVYARRYSSDGNALGGEFRVNVTTTNDQDSPVVAMADDGRFVVVWEGQGAGDTSGVFARWYSSTGVAETGEVRVNTTTTDIQGEPSVDMTADGRSVIIWDSDAGVLARTYDASGTPTSAEIVVDNGLTAGEADVAIAADGSFVVVWRETALDIGIYARRYNASGTALGSATVVSTTIVGDQTNPSIAMDAAGNYVVVWEGVGPGDLTGVFSREYDSSGTALDSFDSRVNSTTTGIQSMASAAMIGPGNYIIVWSGEGSSDASGVYARQYSNSNTAPNLAPSSPSLTAVDQNAGTPVGAVGTQVSTLIDPAGGGGRDNLVDPDNPATYGVVITAANALHGTWWFSTDNGVSWQELGAVSDSFAKLLYANAQTRIAFAPKSTWHGTISDAITFRAWDGTENGYSAFSNGATVNSQRQGLSHPFSIASTTASLQVNQVNNPPQANNDSYSTNEDQALNVTTGGLLANDTDSESNTLTAQLVAGPAHGSLTLNTNGTFTYTPNANFHGSDTFTYRAHDGLATSNVATATINVTPVNDPPQANNDSYTTNEDQTLNVTTGGLLANDSDVEGNPLTAQLVAGPTHGSLTLNTNGTFTYAPNANFHGTDTFTYRAHDGSTTSNIATVTINVTPVNDPPQANNDSYSTNEDQTLNVTTGGLLANDTDIEGNALTAQLVAGPTHGSLTLNTNGTFTYTPNANFHGTDTFTYRAHDGSATSNIATVTINVTPVNDPPQANNDNYTTNEDQTLNVTTGGLLANDTDVDGNPLTAQLVAGPAHGSLTLDANGRFTYTPNANFHGTDTFTYRAHDGSTTSNIATVTINVTPVNDPPQANNDSYSTNEDQTLNVTTGGLLTNDTDIEGNALTAQRVAGPAHGSLTLNANGTFTYTPNANFHGSDTFTYRAHDGSTTSNIATVTINVTPVNDPPQANNDSYSTNEDQTLNVTTGGLLTNDTDVEGNPLTAQLVAGPAHGSLTLNANGRFTYTPNANFHGSDTFTYRAHDGSTTSNIATVTINVTPVNDPPQANNDSYSTNEDQTLNVTTGGLLANDTDIEGNTLTAQLVAGPAHGSLTLNANGRFTYTPNANFHGSDTFTYRAHDGSTTSNIATVTINVTPVNDPPQANNESYSTNEDQTLNVTTGGLLANDTDIEGNTLTAQRVAGPAHGSLTLNANGTFTYTPNANFHGSDTFTYRAHDGSTTSNVATVTINVTPVNDPPRANNDTYSTNEDQPLNVTTGGLLTNDTDIEGNTLSAQRVAGPAHGSLTLNANGTFTYTPNANFHGSDTFTYRAHDGSTTSNIATVTINVLPVNDPPQAIYDSYTTFATSPLIVNRYGVLANDANPDNVSLTAVLITGPAHGALRLNADGTFVYQPDANFIGRDSFTYAVNDGVTLSAPATVMIDVQPLAVAFSTEAPQASRAPSAANDSAKQTTQTDSASANTATTSSATPTNIVVAPVHATNGTTSQSMGDNSDSSDAQPAASSENSQATTDDLVAPMQNTAIEGVTRQSRSFLQLQSTAGARSAIDAWGTSPSSYSSSITYDLDRESRTLQMLSQPGVLWERLDEFQQSVDSPMLTQNIIVGSVGGVASGFTAGYVIWMVRGGVLLSSLLTQLPAWRFFDPIVVMGATSIDGSDDDESIESIVDKGYQPNTPNAQSTEDDSEELTAVFASKLPNVDSTFSVPA